MSHPRALDEQEAIAAEQWFQDYERVGTFRAKCRELRVTPHTLRDAIRRVRGQLTKNTREKISGHEIVMMATEIHQRLFHEEPTKSGEEQSENADAV